MGELRQSDFRAAWWLRGAHLQTLWPSLFRRRELPELERERVELADGDFGDLARARNGGPPVVVIHGLEGSLESPRNLSANTLIGNLDRKGSRATHRAYRECPRAGFGA
jgi:predicted alpha/beta-fold hydrolase